MFETVESEAPAFRAFPGPGDFERRFDSSIENSPELASRKLNRLRRVDIEEIGNKRVVRWNDGGLAEVSRLVVVGRAKANPGDDGKPPKVSSGAGELVKRIESQGVVIVGERAIGKAAVEISEACFALVKNGAAKKGRSFDVERDLRQALGCLEKVVGLETRDTGKGVVGVVFRNRDDVVRLRIKLKFALEKILEHKLVAQLRDIADRVGVLGKDGPASQGNAVSSL